MKRVLSFVLACLLQAFLFGSDTPDGASGWSWAWKGSDLLIRFHLNKGYYAYPEETGPVLSPSCKPSAVPAVRKHLDPLLDDSIDVYAGPGDFVWRYPVHKLQFPLTVSVKWQMCQEGSAETPGACLMPGQALLAAFPSAGATPAALLEKTDISADEASGIFLLPDYQVLRAESGYLPPEKFIAFLHGERSSAFSFAGRGIFMSLLLALLGGIALNLTPCVLPMIPVNLAMIGAGSNSTYSRRKRILLGLLYGAGITTAYGLLGVAAVLTGSTFGGLDSSWIFNLCAALIFAALGCAMFDLFHLDLSGAAGRFRMPSAAHFGGVFLMGALSALLAGACVAPVIAAALVQASQMASGGNYAGLLLPFLVGMGMALPWPLAAAGMSLFPKPGAWMNHVKHALGILILLLAVYYFWTAGALFLRSAQQTGPGKDTGADKAYAMVTAALNESGKTGKPVLLDFGASWCKACSMMEIYTMKDPSVQKAMEDVIFVKIQAETPSDPATASLLKEFYVTGLPSFLLLKPEK